MSADTLVLGAGIIGVSTAIHLARRGRSVVFCEAAVVTASGQPAATATLVYRISQPR